MKNYVKASCKLWSYFLSFFRKNDDLLKTSKVRSLCCQLLPDILP